MIYLFLASGFEECEALVTLDLLRRAGISIKTVGVTGKSVTGSHGITVTADLIISDISLSDCEGVILPGGMPGTDNLFLSDEVKNTVRYCYDKNYLVAAICAAPLILGRMGLLNKKQAVCFPGVENELQGAILSDLQSVVSNNIITAKAAGAVFEFSFSIIKYLLNEQTAFKVINSVYYKGI